MFVDVTCDILLFCFVGGSLALVRFIAVSAEYDAEFVAIARQRQWALAKCQYASIRKYIHTFEGVSQV